jgi:hypothetical protein
LPKTGGVLFVVDAADSDRLGEVVSCTRLPLSLTVGVGQCEEELSALAIDTQLWGVPMAVLFNKVRFVRCDLRSFLRRPWFFAD